MKKASAGCVGLDRQADHQLTVSDAMTQTMVNWGIRSVFGMVGHSNLGLADALRRREADGALTYYGIRHEGAAAFACSGYAKLTGRPAACLSIAGPGATNLLTGLYDAKVDRAPVLALTGQVQVQVLALGSSFSNHTGITSKRPIIQVDFEAMQLGKFHPVTLPVWAR